MIIKTNIFDDSNMIENFIQDNDLSDCNIFEEYFESNNEPIINTVNNCQYDNIGYCDLQVGDIIDIEYIPNSQKYIPYYENNNTYGRVFYLHGFNGLLYHDSYDNGILTRYIDSIEKEYCSYYGDTFGYGFFIRRYYN